VGTSRLPTEVELVYELMPCNALRTAQEPLGTVHPCTYFRKWGTYHSYDYALEGAPRQRGVVQESVYVGRAPLVPEALSGCRKAPIMAVAINPNLPGWYPRHRRSVFPLFDDYRQYAHYFRFRSVDKVELAEADYRAFGGSNDDNPFSQVVLNVPLDENGRKTIRLQPQPQQMYEVYQGLLDALAEVMAWPSHQLVVGEDLAYGNMVASPSARWTTKPLPDDPALPPMTEDERDGIVAECFTTRRYFSRQLFQSLPAVILIFSQTTANAFIGEFHDRFVVGHPEVGEPLEQLMQRPMRLSYGDLQDGNSLEARVICAPHATGNPQQFARVRQLVVAQLVEEAQAGNLRYDARSGHLVRPPGGCVFCPMLEIAPCDYVDQLQPLANAPQLTADSPVELLMEEKELQLRLLGDGQPAAAARAGWNSDDVDEPIAARER
jgi:hypothetical protein